MIPMLPCGDDPLTCYGGYSAFTFLLLQGLLWFVVLLLVHSTVKLYKRVGRSKRENAVIAVLLCLVFVSSIFEILSWIW